MQGGVASHCIFKQKITQHHRRNLKCSNCIPCGTCLITFNVETKMPLLRLERNRYTYISSHFGPWSLIKCLTSSSNRTVNVLRVAFSDMGDYVSCPRIVGGESFSWVQFRLRMRRIPRELMQSTGIARDSGTALTGRWKRPD